MCNHFWPVIMTHFIETQTRVAGFTKIWDYRAVWPPRLILMNVMLPSCSRLWQSRDQSHHCLELLDKDDGSGTRPLLGADPQCNPCWTIKQSAGCKEWREIDTQKSGGNADTVAPVKIGANISAFCISTQLLGSHRFSIEVCNSLAGAGSRG